MSRHDDVIPSSSLRNRGPERAEHVWGHTMLVSSRAWQGWRLERGSHLLGALPLGSQCSCWPVGTVQPSHLGGPGPSHTSTASWDQPAFRQPSAAPEGRGGTSRSAAATRKMTKSDQLQLCESPSWGCLLHSSG